LSRGHRAWPEARWHDPAARDHPRPGRPGPTGLVQVVRGPQGCGAGGLQGVSIQGPRRPAPRLRVETGGRARRGQTVPGGQAPTMASAHVEAADEPPADKRLWILRTAPFAVRPEPAPWDLVRGPVGPRVEPGGKWAAPSSRTVQLPGPLGPRKRDAGQITYPGPPGPPARWRDLAEPPPPCPRHGGGSPPGSPLVVYFAPPHGGRARGGTPVRGLISMSMPPTGAATLAVMLPGPATLTARLSGFMSSRPAAAARLGAFARPARP